MKLREQLKRLTIKRELPAERCEICHQDDCFDPVKNYCSRCANFATTIVSTNNLSTNSNTRPNRTTRARNRRSDPTWGELFYQLIFGILTVILFLSFFMGGLTLAQKPIVVSTVKYYFPLIKYIGPLLIIPYLLICCSMGATVSIYILDGCAKIPSLLVWVYNRLKNRS